VFKMISGDKAKTQTYCDLTKIAQEAEAIDRQKDANKADELSSKLTNCRQNWDPTMNGLQDIDPNSKDAQEIGATLEAFDKLCAR
jgi:hypothetical protein